MRGKISGYMRLLFAFLIFFSSLGVYHTVMMAGKNMIVYGNEMASLTSKAGTSLAEHYYRLHGEIYAALGSAIANSVAIVLISGIFISFLLVYPIVVSYLKYRKEGTLPIDFLQNKF